MTARKRRTTLLAGLIVLGLVGFIASLLIGPVPTGLSDLWRLVAKGDRDLAAIVIDLRFCRALLAFFVGAGLALAGAILQGFFQNPLADPFVLGVSSGSSFGAVLAIQLGLGVSFAAFSIQSLFAFVSGLLLVSFIYLFSRRRGVLKVETLLLTGIALGALASALTSFLLFLRTDSFEQAVFWLLGSFALAEWNQVGVVAPYVLASLLVAQWLARDMNLLSLGDETARSLGCPVDRVRGGFLVLATILAASAVSVSGIIGFVGLIVPHWVRIWIGPDHRHLFPFSALTGGVFLVFCDLAARSLLPATELPIGIITAAAGAPFFVYLLHRRS
jgi:iron complex transport system permease protein